MIRVTRSLRKLQQACLIETLEDRALFSVVSITPSSNWLSAVNSSAPGDTINFAAGNYVVPTTNTGTQLPGSGRVYSGASGATFVGASGSKSPELMLNSGGEAKGFTISNVEFAAAGTGDNVHDNTFVNGAFAWVEAGLSNSHFDHNTFNSCNIDGYLGNNDTVDYNFFQNSGEPIHFGGASPQNTDISNNVILNASHYGMELGLNCNGLTVNNNYITLYGTDSNTAVCGISAACGANATAPYANAGENMMFSGNTIVADSAGVGCGIEIMGDYNIQINNNFITGFGPGWWPCILNGTGGQRGGGLQTNNNTFIAGNAYADGDSTPWSTPPRVSNGDKLYGLNASNRPATPAMPTNAGASKGGSSSTPVTTTPVTTPATTPVLTSQYLFDQSSGTSTSDASGNGNTANLAGQPSFVAANRGSGSGNALSLNGSNQYASISNSSTLNPTSSITLSAWIDASDWNGNRRVLQKGSSDNQYRLLAENGSLKFDLANVGTVTASLPSTNTWHLVTGTYDGSTMTLYVDGKAVASANHSGSINVTGDPLVIGNKTTSDSVAGDHFKGFLDDVRVYNGAISASQVQSLYSAGASTSTPTPPVPTPVTTPVTTPVSSSGPVAQYTFSQNSGSTTTDASGNGNNATLQNSPAIVTSKHNTVSGNALSLNGSNQYASISNSSTLNPTSSITLSAWIDASDWNGNRRVLQKGSSDNQYRLLAENGSLKFDLANVGTVTASLPSTNTWHLVTGTYDGSTMTLYVDGKAVASANHNGSINVTGDPLVIGNKTTSDSVAGDHFKGLLDEVRVYNRSLSSAEVSNLFATT